MHSRAAAVPLLAIIWLTGCDRERESRVFELLSPERTGVTFANTITTSDSVNVQTDVYVYNGAGVAVGDIDNDGLLDLFFAGNMVTSRLYLNKGGMRFEDITERAGTTTKRWATGVTMVDINADGWLDIYVSVSGPEWSKGSDRSNLLFVNNHNRTFTESAARFALADTGFTTHSAFFDYDGDGCLDVFLLNNSPKDFSRSDINRQPAGMRAATPGSYNELYRNGCNGTFTNVSARAGILREPGYGLGVAISDLNRDGRPDVYVSNDATPNDVIYVNGGDGTFRNKAGAWLKHSSVAGMGVDAADINNDGWPDLLQVDMMPSDLARRKRTNGYLTFTHLLEARSRGFRDDYSINSLQLSNGLTDEGDVVFSDIARLAGVAHTDWSWSALFADFDNDGHKDIFIGNGYPKAVNDLDYVYAALSARSRERNGGSRRPALELLRHLPAYHEPNYVFRNEGDLTFSDRSREWGVDRPSFSYGAAYGDLDNDGRLDLVVNNIDAPAFVLHNVRRRDEASHWLRVQLEGDSANPRGIGATLVLTVAGAKQYLYQSPYRGYMSTVDDRLHFGLGRAMRADSLEVFWPDGRYHLLTAVDADRVITVSHRVASAMKRAIGDTSSGERLFAAMPRDRAPMYAAPSGSVNDYSIQPLLPYQISRRGPPLAVGDANGDGLEDVFLGGVSGAPRKLFLQSSDGGFTESRVAQPWTREPGFDDWGALFFDADGDGRQDLYVASGGYELGPEAPELQDRLYLNKGNGRFARAADALPQMLTSTAAVRAADFNGDGRLDLFVGGRLTPRNWPLPTRSYLLRNDGARFVDVTEQMAPELVRPGGMVTDATWIDFDGDRDLDLVTAGEWMPIEFYRNDGGRLRRVTSELRLPPLRGWWYSLAAGDFDGDGLQDLVAGNLGLNYSYTTSEESRFGVYVGDFSGSRMTDVVLAQEIGGVEYPLGGLAPLGQTIYTLPLRFPTYGAFATASMPQLFGDAALRQALHYQADTFASVFLHNEGGKGFTMSALPSLAQIAPIRAIVVDDVDGDGRLDLVVAGNLYDVEPNTPRADAGNGLWLRGDGKGGFQPVSPRVSGFLAPSNVTGLAAAKTNTGVGILVANAGDSLQAFSIKRR
jgi:hypothetical protein